MTLTLDVAGVECTAASMSSDSTVVCSSPVQLERNQVKSRHVGHNNPLDNDTSEQMKGK